MDRYLTAYFYCHDPKVWWHEVKADPGKFPTQAEMQERLFEAWGSAFKLDEDDEVACRKAIEAAYPGRAAN